MLKKLNTHIREEKADAGKVRQKDIKTESSGSAMLTDLTLDEKKKVAHIIELYITMQKRSFDLEHIRHEQGQKLVQFERMVHELKKQREQERNEVKSESI